MSVTDTADTHYHDTICGVKKPTRAAHSNIPMTPCKQIQSLNRVETSS